MTQHLSPESRELFQLVVENVHDFAVFVIDPDGQVVSWNPGVESLLGYTEAEFLGQHVSLIFTPEDRERQAPEHEMRTALREGRAEDKRWHLREDGSHFWGNGLMMLLRDETGGVRGFAKIMRDDTGLKQIADRLRSQLHLTDTITGSLLEGIHVLDREGCISFMNRAAQEMLGWTEEELLGKGQHQMIHSRREDGTPHPEEECPIIGVLRTVDPVRDYETVYTRKDGSMFPVLCTSAPILTDGQVTGAVMSFHDITERKRVEAALRESEGRYRVVAETASDAILTIDEASTILFANPAAEKVFGHDARALVGQSLTVLMPEYFRQLHRAGLNRYVETGHKHISWEGVELMGLHREGHEIPIEVSFGEFRESGRRFFTGVVRDISVRKRAEEERERLLERERQAREEAEQANRLKDEFLATLSHELRTPLTPILGWSRMLVTGQLDGAQAKSALVTIERNAVTQAQLIEDVLDVSRIITGKLRLDVRPVDLAFVIRAALDSVSFAAGVKDVRLQPVLDSGTSGVMGDPARLQQVVWNLLSNAIKFTPKGGRVQVLLERVNSHVEIVVSDSGPGISPDVLPYIFERFRQADQSTTRQHGGLGLGLAIVRHLVEAHGGTVEAENVGEGQGASFRVRLPLMIVRGAAQSKQDGAEGGYSPANDGGAAIFTCPPELEGLHVLVVDDEEDARDLLKAVLEKCGAEVTLAGSAAAALRELEGMRYDALVSDIGMPGEDGYWLIKKVRALSPERGGRTPAAALTAYAGAKDRLRVLRAGFQMHVTKPVEPTELVTVVANLAGRTSDGESG